ncbi:MAG: arginine--tRNA ligase [Actinobacteria bacterium]|nr:arginine--tRNA ligase [Actinomycetota bacterium]
MSVEISLAKAVSAALDRAVASGALPEGQSATFTAEKIPLERPKNRDHGDFATSIALVLAKSLGRNPRDVAAIIAKELESESSLSKVEIAGPGFINFTLNSASQGEIIESILEKRESFGRVRDLAGMKINLEFISANPTGPIHLGHTRWAAVGDALGRILIAAGAEVTREFYINDRGVQMDLFGASLRASALGIARPEEGYQGVYIDEIARDIMGVHPEYATLPERDSIVAFREAGYAHQLAEQKEVVKRFGTQIDIWFSERELHQGDSVLDATIKRYRKQGNVFESEGALWLRTSTYGDDKDRVLKKSSGEYTYFASDTAYYLNKRSRGFDLAIYMLGADHHGYIGRLKATAACAGDDPHRNIEILIGQMVKIIEGGEEIKLSKRAGTIVTLEDLVEKVGVDAARYTLIRFPVETPMVVDVDLLKKHTNENPVYYVQYAHARISALLRNASDLGVKFGVQALDPALLSHERERELIGALAQFPTVVSSAAETRAPHRIARYIEELAGTYHGFYSDCRVLPMSGEAPSALHSARVTLCDATRQVIANALGLLGVTAPERM